MATATLQTVWDCRWSRPGHQITGLSEAVQPEPTWVCVRDGNRRAVCADECARCSRWEPIEASRAVAFAHAPGAILTDHAVEAMPLPTVAELANASLRALLVFVAAVFIALGVTMLEGPMSVPFTIVMWLCAAAFVGLAVFGRFAD